MCIDNMDPSTTYCFGKPQNKFEICIPGALELSLAQFGRCNFCVTIAFLDVSSKKGAYRDISHIILKHTQ